MLRLYGIQHIQIQNIPLLNTFHGALSTGMEDWTEGIILPIFSKRS